MQTQAAAAAPEPSEPSEEARIELYYEPRCGVMYIYTVMKTSNDDIQQQPTQCQCLTQQAMFIYNQVSKNNQNTQSKHTTNRLANKRLFY